MGVEQRKEFYKVCRVAFELVCNGLTPYNLNSGDVYIKNLGRLQSDDLRVRKIITRILNSPKETPDTIFESLKEGIRAINGGRIFNQIENLNNPRMCVLLVGKEDDLIKGVASYISSLYSTDCLLERNYSGLPEEYIIKNLLQPNPEYPKKYSLFDLYLKNTNVLFLRGLENLSPNIVKYIARVIDDTTNDVSGRRGFLIIGTDDIASLPDYFVRQFEIVNLETEKQDRDAAIPPSIEKEKQVAAQHNIEPECQGTPQNTPGSKDTPSEIIRFPTPKGAKWHEVDISFTDNDHVKIKVRDVVKTLHYSQMGFKHKQAVKYVKPWETLRRFVMKNGIVPFQKMNIKKGETVSSTNEILVTQDDVKELKKKLCIYFGIEVNPISYDKENAVYKASFKIRDDTELFEKYSNKVNNSDNSDTETDKIQSDDYDSNRQDKYSDDT